MKKEKTKDERTKRKSRTNATFLFGALKKVRCVLHYADCSEQLRHSVRTRDFTVRKGCRALAAVSTHSLRKFSSSVFIAQKNTSQPKRVNLYFGALKKIRSAATPPTRTRALQPFPERLQFVLRRTALFESFHLFTKNKKAHHKGELFYFGALKKIRTPDLLVRSQTLYPAELSAQNILKCYGTQNRHSIIAQMFNKINS